MRKRWILLFFSILSFCAGQSVTPDAFLQAVDGGTLRVPANSAGTVFPLKVTSVVEGRDVIRVGLTHPQLQISLITPASVEVTSANAASLGYEWTSLNAATPSLSFPFASSAGDHVLIGLPAGAQPGIYQVKANATGISGDTGIQVTYWSNSGVRAGAVCDSTVPTGSSITISGLLFSGTTPVTGASVNATILLETDVTAGASIGTYQLVSQVPGPAGATDRTYSAHLTNTGPTMTLAEASIAEAGGVALLDNSLAFRDVPAGGSANSQDTFSVRVPSGGTFDPATLVWEVTSTSHSGTIFLPDSGAQDNAPGDGIYTGVFSPATAGKYSALLTFTGTSAAGVAYSRKAVASFQAASPGGSLVSFQDAAVDDDGNGRKDRLVITATVNVPAASGYRVSLVLIASNGEQVHADAKVTLAAGTGQVPVAVEASSVVSGLGVSGPYKIAHIGLQKDDGGLTPVIDVRDDAGQTAAYPLSDFDRGAIELTGRTATGVNANGIPGFEILRLTVGVAVHGPAGPCNWIATLGGPPGRRSTRLPAARC
ncbi:MAG: choice-of-anchor X domain-containing protein [Bryobacteraceae bacterium]